MPDDADVADVALDLRSDAVTRATPAMWEAMRASRGRAAVAELEAVAASFGGVEAALYVPTGTMANLVALLCHTRPGEQVVAEAHAHVRWSEEWAFAALCSVALCPLPGRRGHVDPAALEAAIAETCFEHRPRTALVWVENAHNLAGGTVAAPAGVAALAGVARRCGARLHLDGARVLNACAAVGAELPAMLAGVDSCTLNLNKGLSAPQGALLLGSAELVAAGRVALRRLGAERLVWDGAQAAAGLEALHTMVPQLARDNARARRLAERLAAIEGVRVDLDGVETNIVMADTAALGLDAAALVERLAADGVGATVRGGGVTRFVTHRHVTDESVERVVALVAEAAAASGGPRHG